MPLDVWIGRPRDEAAEHAVAFVPEAYCWVMHPLFEALRRSHGTDIDLYGRVAFPLSQLSLIYRILDHAEAQARSRPKVWKEQIGVVLEPVRKELHEEAARGGRGVCGEERAARVPGRLTSLKRTLCSGREDSVSCPGRADLRSPLES